MLSWTLSGKLHTTIIPHTCNLHRIPFADLQQSRRHNSQQNLCTELPTSAPEALYSKGPVILPSHLCCISNVVCSCLQASKPASAPITNYFSQQKHPAAISSALARKGGTDVPEHAHPCRPSKGLASMAQPWQAAQNSPAQNGPAQNGPAASGQSRRVNLGAEAEPDLMAHNSLGLGGSLSSRHSPETAAGSRHDTQLEQLLAYTANQELASQSPYASRLRQQDTVQAETPLQRHSTGLYNMQTKSHQVEEASVSSRAGLHDSHAMARQFVASPRAGQVDDRIREGRVAGMSSPDHRHGTPNALTALLDVHSTPKRPSSTHSEGVIVTSPESQGQDDVEINLLSPSPAKR